LGRDAEASCRILFLAAGLWLAGALVMPAAFAADQRHAPADPAQPITFNLPAQPLVSALESYSVVSGWQVVYEASLATGHRSAAVTGDFTPGTALRMLLAGTGLKPEYMASDSVLLEPDPTAAAAVSPAPPVAGAVVFRAYYGRVQAGLKRAFCAEPAIRAGAYRMALSFWIGSGGTVTRAVELGSTGRPEIDAAFDRAVRGLAVGDPPPPGFDQPVVILVTPDLIRQCPAADVTLQPARADK
jgi:Secretin and TonB N terminus short domain